VVYRTEIDASLYRVGSALEVVSYDQIGMVEADREAITVI
jgi:hypothetical protein